MRRFAPPFFKMIAIIYFRHFSALQARQPFQQFAQNKNEIIRGQYISWRD